MKYFMALIVIVVDFKVKQIPEEVSIIILLCGTNCGKTSQPHASQER